MYSFHYLELRFGENLQLCTIKKNWKTEGGVKSVSCDGVEASEPRSNSIQRKEGAPGGRASFICPVDGRVQHTTEYTKMVLHGGQPLGFMSQTDTISAAIVLMI